MSRNTQTVLVRSVKNPLVTRRMTLQSANLNKSNWILVDGEANLPVLPDKIKMPLPKNVKIIVAVIVYDRFDNIKEWVRCWNQCEIGTASLVIVHNYENEHAREAYTYFCGQSGVHYVPRKNIGYDIGAFQDVCRQRLEGFPKAYDYLIWCTDDTIPMRKDFIGALISRVDNKSAVSCMELSKEVKPHIRTTGFCIKKETALKIQFPADPITTKEECWQFEHRSQNSFLEQVQKMGMSATQVLPIKEAPLWDSGQVKAKRQNNRKEEHHRVFPFKEQSKKKITFIALIYNSYPEILSSLINQTHQEWELILIHDGKETYPISKIVEAANDQRITYIQTEERKQNWGHHWRRWALQELKESRLSKESDFVVITNSDNWYAPNFCELMVNGVTANHGAVAAYTSHMIHSYTNWNLITCSPKQGFIDSGNVMVKRQVACEVGWNNVDRHSSDWYYFEDIIKKHGVGSFVSVKGCLFSHN